MKVAGIIAEYNPFHNGHALLIEKARRAGATHVVAVMSSNFVQRGEPAIFHHRERTEAALRGGADLVIQLPCTYALSGARSFARAGIKLLDALGCVDWLVFGSECGDVEKLTRAAKAIYSPEVQSGISEEMSKGLPFATARENALRKLYPESAGLIGQPNNILGVEYIAAIKSIGSSVVPLTFKREGAAHNATETVGATASASLIRELVLSGKDWQGFVPQTAARIFAKAMDEKRGPVSIAENQKAVLYKMRSVAAAELAKAPDVSEGIENRILNAAAKAVTLEELYSLTKTKRYSHARIRRIVMNSFLEITAEDLKISPPYLRITGFNSNGAQLIKTAKETAKLPVITKAADLADLGSDAQRIFAIECRAGDIYSLFTPEVMPCGEEKRFVPIII